MKKHSWRTALVGVLLSVVTLQPTPASAQEVGSLNFEGTANLPTFPCTLNVAQDACSGTFAGTVSGSLAGLNVGKAWTATLQQASMSATFDYRDLALECQDGSAWGSVTINADNPHSTGFYDAGAGLNEILAVSAAGKFEWAREGLTAVVTLYDLVVTVTVAGALPGQFTNVTVVLDGGGRAVAGFVPLISSLPDCEGNNPVAITARVAGSAAVEE